MRGWAILGLALVAACSNAPAPKDSYRRGIAALEAGDARTARVEFLNVLKAAPNNKAARILQARTHIALGDGVAAEAEIARARALGVSPTVTAPLMAHALFLQGRTEDAAERLGGATGAYAERMRGLIFAAQGKNADAGAAFGRAIDLAPNDAEVWKDVARFRRTAGDIGGALEATDRAIAIDRADTAAIMLRGELTRGQYGLRASLPWFDRAIALDGTNVTARVERAATLGDMGAMHEMLSETRRILYRSPKNPMAYYLQAMLAARAGNFQLARSLYQRTEARLDDTPAVMLLAGAIHYQTGDAEQAVSRLQPLVEKQPENARARRLLAAAQWKLGNAAGTAQTLRPLADRPDADSYTLILMGNALARLGNGPDASLYLTRAAYPARRSASALLYPSTDTDSLARLRDEAGLRPDDAQTQIRLIRALLSAGLGGEALERARALQTDNPGAPDAHILVGDALAIRGQFGPAAEQYRKAANIAFTEPTAMRMIEALQRSGQDQAATNVLSLFLQQNPSNVPAQLLAASRFLQASRWDEAIAGYEKLRVQLGDSDAVMLNNLAWAYSEKGDYAQALPLAKQAWLLDRDNPATTDTFGWILYKSGKDKARGLILLQRAAKDASAGSQTAEHLKLAQAG